MTPSSPALDGVEAWPAFAALAPFTLQDFPGTPAAMVFTQGCNLRCAYCHNPQLISDGPLVDGQQVASFLSRRQGRLAGLVITGGEPTLHRGLGIFLRHCKALGYRIKLDSNGMRPEVIEDLLACGVVDYLAFDWKLPGHRYGEVHGPSNAGLRLQRCAAAARSAGIAWEWRTTLAAPLCTDEALADIAAGMQAGDRWALQQLCTQRPLLNGEGLHGVDTTVVQDLIAANPHLDVWLRSS